MPSNSNSKKRRTQGGSSSSSSCSPPQPSAAAGEDRISELPEALRLQILSLLPLKSAIRTGALSSRWRSLWTHRWPNPSSLHFNLSSSSSSSFLQEQEEQEEGGGGAAHVIERRIRLRGRRRLDCFSLTFHPGQVLPADFKRWLEYAAACSVEDLHLHLIPTSTSSGRSTSTRGRRAIPTFPFPPGSPLLARLSLRGLHLSASAPSSLLSTLEVIHLHSVSLTDAALRKVVAACLRLRSLDLRCCRHLRRVDVSPAGPHLASLSLIECPRASELRLSPASRLRSFRFSGAFLSKYHLGSTTSLQDVYICSGGPELGLPSSNWLSSLGHLSNLTVLTLCSIALQYVSASATTAIGELRNFRSLRELQLLMLGMANSNLTDIYSFLKTCRCPQLERLFVQLPTNTHDPFTENYLEVAEEEPPEDGLENLTVVKMSSFKGHRNEMRLVRFLLRKASCLSKLALFSPREHVVEELQKARSDMHHFLKSQLLLLEKASGNAQIIVSEFDDFGIQPSHSEIFVKF